MNLRGLPKWNGDPWRSQAQWRLEPVVASEEATSGMLEHLVAQVTAVGCCLAGACDPTRLGNIRERDRDKESKEREKERQSGNEKEGVLSPAG